jgi:hypothetical protein
MHFLDASAFTFCRCVRFFLFFPLIETAQPDHTAPNRLNRSGGGGGGFERDLPIYRLPPSFPHSQTFKPEHFNLLSLLTHSHFNRSSPQSLSKMVCRRNPSVVEFNSDSDEIQEESPVPSPPPRRSLSKRGHDSGRMEGEGSSMPSQPARGRHQKVGATHPRRSTSSSGYAPC